jgi:hypothetical protein
LATCVRKCFHAKTWKCQKVSDQDKKKSKSANLSKCTEALKEIVGASNGLEKNKPFENANLFCENEVNM